MIYVHNYSQIGATPQYDVMESNTDLHGQLQPEMHATCSVNQSPVVYNGINVSIWKSNLNS